MKAAFEILGIPTWHWISQAENPPDLLMWVDTLRTRWEHESSRERPIDRTTLDNLLGKWAAVTDTPTAFISEDLIQAYPEAKVVLHERDIDRWYESYCNTVIASNNSPFIPFATMIDRNFIGQMAQQTDLIAKYYFGVTTPRTRMFGLVNNSEFFEQWRRNAKAVYRAHYERVKRATPPEKLLLFKLEQGWEPLCEFLGKPVPDVPFPRVNETAALQELVNAYIMESYRRSAVRFLRKAVPTLIVVAAIVVWWKM